MSSITGGGVALAFLAMLSWGFGDFWIQRSVKRVGDVEALFIVTAFGALLLLPFTYRDIPIIFGAFDRRFLILLSCAIIIFAAALLDFEALRQGKLAVVEPLWSFEVVVSGLMAFFILSERINALQIALIAFLLASLLLVAIRNKPRHFLRSFFLEKAVLPAFLGGLLMGASNFFLGWGSRAASPLMANFFLNIFITAGTGAVLFFRGTFRRIVSHARKNSGLLLSMCISDNIAWVAFAYAMTLAPIAVATALSESYIIVAVLLGLAVNKEKLQAHQKIGLAGAILSAITLAALTAS